MKSASALFLAFLLLGCHHTQDAVPSGASRAVFHVEGLSCEGCESGVKAALERIEGVEQAEVSHKKSQTSVTYDPAKVSPRELEAAIEAVGYQASLRSGTSSKG